MISPETRDTLATKAAFGQYSSFSKVILIANSEMFRRWAETGRLKLEADLEIDREMGGYLEPQNGLESKNPPTPSGDFISVL
jgi:hypothetical protein